MGQRFKSLIEIINKKPDTVIIHTSTYSYYPTAYYLESNINLLLTKNPLSNDTVQFIGGQKSQIPENENSFWLVDSKKWVDYNEYKILEKEFNKFNVVESFFYGNVELKYLERN